MPDKAFEFITCPNCGQEQAFDPDDDIIMCDEDECGQMLNVYQDEKGEWYGEKAD